MRRLRGSEGFAAVELATFTGLILLPALFLVASLPTWWERASLSRVAAQQAAREVALAADWDQGLAAARDVTAQTAANHGVDPSAVDVTFDGALARGAEVTATVTIEVPALNVPLVATTPTFSYSSRTTELVDAYRGF